MRKRFNGGAPAAPQLALHGALRGARKHRGPGGV